MRLSDLKKISTNAWKLLIETFKDFFGNNVPRLAAALAYYSIFSIAPLLVIAIAVAGLIFGNDAAQVQVVTELQNLVGKDAAGFVQHMIISSSKSSSTIIATILGVIFLLFGAIAVTFELKDDLNLIWGVQPKPGIKGLIWSRVFSFGLVLALGFLLLISLMINSFLTGIGNYLLGIFPAVNWILSIVNLIVSYALITLLFAAIFRVIPDADLRWRNVWTGAFVTMVLFSIGKYLIGLYLGNTSFSSSYGAAGSLVVVLLWVNFTSQIVLFGAEFTKVYSRMSGYSLRPKSYAEAVKNKNDER